MENSLETNSELKKLFDIELGEDVLGYMNSGTGKNLLPPPHTQWHHPVESIDIMQLLRKQEHTNPLLQDILHPGPNGTGGFGAYFKEPMK
ncbi:hypothetical protein JW887_00920 [Candidatus Dojkabacteria bacterium]|nr:hypothetical protein [Candidatus Dojkabacteria bacterium]